MNALSLTQLSFESAESDEEVVYVHPESALATDIKIPTENTEFEELQTVLEVYTTVVERGSVCRDDLNRVKGLSVKYPVLARLFDCYPIGTFTAEPSGVNYEVSTESFIKTAYAAVVAAFKAVIRFIVETFKTFWKFLTDNRTRTTAVDNLDTRLKAIQAYLVKVDDVAGTSRVSTEYTAWMRRGRNTALHNLNKKWNGFLQHAATNEVVFRGYFDSVNAILRNKTPIFTDAVDVFFAELKKATSEAEINVAIAKMDFTNMSSDALTLLSKTLGYKVGGVAIDPRMTNFHAMASFVKGVFVGMSNNRTQVMEAGEFYTLTYNASVTPWADELDKTINWSHGKENKTIGLLEKFNVSDLQPGLEDVYTRILTPYIAALTSITQGLATLERVLGMLVAGRNAVMEAIAEGALQTAKQADRFIAANRDKLTISEKTVLQKYTAALGDAFKKEHK